MSWRALALVSLVLACSSEPDASTPPADAGSGGASGTGFDAGTGDGSGGVTAPSFTRYAADRAASPVTESVALSLRAIAERDAGRDARLFAKVGASGTVSSSFMACFAGDSQPAYMLDLYGRDVLLESINWFRAGDAEGTTPFDRITLAAMVGKSAGWAISGSPSPLEQEVSALNPRFALVNYGTNDMQLGVSHASALFPFFENLSALLDELEAGGVVPIVTGLNPRSDSVDAARWVPSYDAVTRGLAEARQLPYLSLYRAMHLLPEMGLVSDGIHGNVFTSGGQTQPCVFTPEALAYNYNVRNLATMELLDVTKRVLVDGAPAPDVPPAPYAGSGSAEDPFVIDGLPFTHAANTAAGTPGIDLYAGCAAAQDESGPELYYRLELDAPAALRVMVLDREGVDVDVHWLAGAPVADSCQARHDRLLEATLPAGTHHFAVDSFTERGTPRSGPYLFVLVRCESDDPACQ